MPNQFGLDAVLAVRRMEMFYRSLCVEYDGTWVNTNVNVFFVGNQWEKLLPTISPKDYGLLRECTIITTSGLRVDYQFSNDDFAINRIYPRERSQTYPGHLAWTQGAELWKLQQDYYDNGTLNANYKKILAESSRTGVLVPQTAYIVVETEAQRKMLAVKQFEAANANTALDFDYDANQVDAPTLLVLLAGLAVVFFIRKFKAKFRNG